VHGGRAGGLRAVRRQGVFERDTGGGRVGVGLRFYVVIIDGVLGEDGLEDAEEVLVFFEGGGLRGNCGGTTDGEGLVGWI
jgi:hypothetical protein